MLFTIYSYLIAILITSLESKYLFYVFNINILNTSTIGNKAFGKSLNSTYLRNNVKIPVPPIEVQQQIIEQCEKVDNECSKIIAKTMHWLLQSIKILKILMN